LLLAAEVMLLAAEALPLHAEVMPLQIGHKVKNARWSGALSLCDE